MALVLSRKIGERLKIGEAVEVIVSKILGNRVTLAIVAPEDVRVIRAELDQRENENCEGK